MKDTTMELPCECGSPDCGERVSLSAATYAEICRADRAVLAPGHPLAPARELRRRAAATREDARALKAQAQHQARRARRGVAAAREQTRARVLVVDDSAVFLHAATAVVSAAEGLRLVGAAGSGEEALELLPRLAPDLVLLDVHLPGIDGIETARRILSREPRTVVILISAEPGGLAGAARDAGAVTLLDKADLGARTLDALWLEHRPAES